MVSIEETVLVLKGASCKYTNNYLIKTLITMSNSNPSVPMRTRPAVTPPKGVTTKTPTVVINTSTQPRSPRRWAFRHPDRIEIGGGAIFPKISCSRRDIGAAVLAIGAAAALVYGAKSAHEYFKNILLQQSSLLLSLPLPLKDGVLGAGHGPAGNAAVFSVGKAHPPESGNTCILGLAREVGGKAYVGVAVFA